MSDSSRKGFEFNKTFGQNDFNRFAVLSGDDNPIHVDLVYSSKSRFGATVAHGMLLYSILCSVIHKCYPDTIQLYQELTFLSPTYAGEEVRFSIQNSSGNSAHIDLLITCTRPNGELGCQGISKILSLNHAEIENRNFQLAFTNADQLSTDQTISGLTLGQSTRIMRVFTSEDLNEYMDITEDNNPLYSDEKYAKRLGFRSVVVPTGLLGGMISKLLGTDLPGRGTNWLKQKFILGKPSYLGQQITASVEISRIRKEKSLINLITRCENSIGEVLLSGEALVLLQEY